MSKAQVHVAIALLLQQQKVLVGWRASHQHQGNKYEFPGGKVEQNETPVQACRREVQEEVGIDIETWHASDVIRHEYDDIIVYLHIFYAILPLNDTQTLKTPWTWYTRSELNNLNFPKANDSILQRLYWKHEIKIGEQLTDLEHLKDSQYLYLRQPLSDALLEELNALPAERFAQLILNIDVYSALNADQQQGLAAIHLKQQQLMSIKPNQLQIGRRYIAACHDQVSAISAQQIGCDAILLSPVQATATHENVPALGWEAFEDIARRLEIPVFALGGLKPTDLSRAQGHHAYGVAGIREF